MTIDTKVLRSLAAVLRERGGQNVSRLNYAKGEWQLGRDKTKVNGTQWGAHVDWLVRGWCRWWDARITDYRVGYAIDGFIPPSREELGDHDRDEWRIWNRGRDPWQLAWSLPLWNQVSGEELLWTTDTMGGYDCLSALLTAFADRIDSKPADAKTHPIVELASGSYRHPERGLIHIPILDIVGWKAPPDKPRPPLPKAEPAPALLRPKTEPALVSASEVKPAAQTRSIQDEFD